MVSLVNSARRAAGNSTLGWLNPALYAYAPLFVNDITSGDNKCLTANVPCCPQGFTASTGWDPVTGLGSLDFGKFLHTFTHFVAPVETPPIFSEASQWMVMQGYEQAGCSGNQNDVLALSGFPTNQCLVQYDNYSNPVASVRFSCGGRPGILHIFVVFFHRFFNNSAILLIFQALQIHGTTGILSAVRAASWASNNTAWAVQTSPLPQRPFARFDTIVPRA